MTTVRVQNSYELLHHEYEELARIIRNKSSLEIINSSQFNLELFTSKFFESYELRLKYLKNDKDKFIFITFKDVSDFSQIDSIIFDKFSDLYSIQINDLTSLGNFLESQDLHLVLTTSSSPSTSSGQAQNQVRYLLSYSYLLKNRVIFILTANSPQYLFEKQIFLNFSEAFLNFYINEKLTDLNLSAEYSASILQEINGDISLINTSIKKILTNEIQRQLSIFEEKSGEKSSDYSLQSSVRNEDISAPVVIPAKAGIQGRMKTSLENTWIPSHGTFLTTRAGNDNLVQTEDLEDHFRVEDEELKNFAKQNIVEEIDDSSNQAFEEQAEIIVPESKAVQEDSSTKKPTTSHLEKKEISNFKTEYLNLTSREEAIYEALVDKKFITRQELAALAWGEDKANEVKDDAIDQVISRLRRKFVKAGFEKNYIYAKKGEGIGVSIQ